MTTNERNAVLALVDAAERISGTHNMPHQLSALNEAVHAVRALLDAPGEQTEKDHPVNQHDRQIEDAPADTSGQKRAAEHAAYRAEARELLEWFNAPYTDEERVESNLLYRKRERALELLALLAEDKP